MRSIAATTRVAAALVAAATLLLLAGCAPEPQALGDPGRGWTTLHDVEHGLTVRFPSSWRRARENVLPYLGNPVAEFALGTFPLRRGTGEDCPQMPERIARDAGPTDVFVLLLERRHPGKGYPPRPHPFALGAPIGQLECIPNSPRYRVYWRLFRDAGRGFYVLALIGRDAPPERVHKLHLVLDSLRFTRT